MSPRFIAWSLAVFCYIGTSDAASPPPIHAEYESDLTYATEDGVAMTRTSAWTLERGQDYVIVKNPQRNVEERWVRDDGQRVWYTRIFHTERRVLEYAPADLKLTGGISNWGQIQSIIDPQALATLHEVTDASIAPGEAGVTYRGEHNGQSVELRWLVREQLPSYIRKQDRRGVQTMKLLSVRDIAPDQPKARDATYAGYDILEFSDIGDRHHDPFIERLVKSDGVFAGH